MPKSSRGFTILELIIIIGILGILFFVVVIATRSQETPSGNAQRRADVNNILSALESYRDQHNGKLPDGVTAEAKTITSTPGSNNVNLCAAMVPSFISTLPLDPTAGSVTPPRAKCTDKDSRYNSGYTVQTTEGRGLRVAAPAAEGGEIIFASN